MIIIKELLSPQKVASRQEELKERARLLLEQARRDAATKNANATAPSRAAGVCDVSRVCVCVCVYIHVCVCVSVSVCVCLYLCVCV